MPKETPAPNAYHAKPFTEASHSFSFPKAIDNYQAEVSKNSMLPGPGNYQNMKELANQNHLAKSMLGGALNKDKKEETDTGLGPAAY